MLTHGLNLTYPLTVQDHARAYASPERTLPPEAPMMPNPRPPKQPARIWLRSRIQQQPQCTIDNYALNDFELDSE